MTKTLTMRLLVDGIEKQRIEAVTEKSGFLTMREIFGEVEVTGEHHINPEAIKDTITAYKALESIHNTEYLYKKVKIEVEYH